MNGQQLYELSKGKKAIAFNIGEISGTICGYSKVSNLLIMAIDYCSNSGEGWKIKGWSIKERSEHTTFIEEKFKENKMGFWYVTEKDVLKD